MESILSDCVKISKLKIRPKIEGFDGSFSGRRTVFTAYLKKDFLFFYFFFARNDNVNVILTHHTKYCLLWYPSIQSECALLQYTLPFLTLHLFLSTFSNLLYKDTGKWSHVILILQSSLFFPLSWLFLFKTLSLFMPELPHASYFHINSRLMNVFQLKVRQAWWGIILYPSLSLPPPPPPLSLSFFFLLFCCSEPAFASLVYWHCRSPKLEQK